MSFTPRQIEILKVSMEMIAKDGIQKLTTKNIAVAMNFTEPSIYRHFKNKASILESILVYYQYQMKEQMKELAVSNISAIDLLTKMVEIQFKYFVMHPALSIVIFSESIFTGQESLSKTIKQIIRKKIAHTEAIISKGQEVGSVRQDISASELSNLYNGSIRFKLLQWKLSDYQMDLVQEAKKLTHTFRLLMK